MGIRSWMERVSLLNSGQILGHSVPRKIVEMRVHIDCPGCESKIKKALEKLDGVDEIDIDMEMQKVTVTGWAEQRKVLKTVRKTGRQVELWPLPFNPAYHDFTSYYHYYYQTPPSTAYYNSSQPSSSYTYGLHGYNVHDHGYYHQPPQSTVIVERATAIFSDENPHACSIM